MATATNTIDTLDVTGKKSGTVELPAELFDVQTNVPLIHQVVVAQLAERAVRNIPSVHVLQVDQLNAYDVLVSDDIVFSKAALEAFVAAKSAKKEEVSA